MNKRLKKIFLCLSILLILFSSLSPFIGVTKAEEDKSSNERYIVLRCQVSTLYIKNESMPIKLKTVVYDDGKPIAESSTVHIEVRSNDGEYKEKTKVEVKSGRTTTKYLPSLEEGYYTIKLYATDGQVQSRNKEEDFGVSKPPIPYGITFNQDGSKIHFKSKKLNSTGQIDPKYNFTLYLYHYNHGEGETLLKKFRDVRDIDINIKRSWRRGIILVDVVGPHGWKNSESIDVDNMQLDGDPADYDYEQEDRYPYKSRRNYYYIMYIIGFIIVAVVVHKLFVLEGDSIA